MGWGGVGWGGVGGVWVVHVRCHAIDNVVSSVSVPRVPV